MQRCCSKEKNKILIGVTILKQNELIPLAESILPEFTEILKQSHPYEIKGIFHSEMLMFCSIMTKYMPEQIIESGRARGQSTEIIARWSANHKINFHSIESNKSNIDCDIAEARLKGLPVNLHYGDSFEIIPYLINNKKTLCLIDGPKGSGMWKLFSIMFPIKSVCGIAMHDSYDGSTVRNNLENQFMGKYIISDNETFVNKFKYLDKECWEINPWGPYEMGSYIKGTVLNLHKSKSYAGTLSFAGK